ncbi:MAG: NAD(P)/FAD-dependent oxidoreductase [Bacteroidales bacterium]
MKPKMNNSHDDSMIIIGAGFAGLAAGIYASMNGYKTRIFEMHDKPGGLCTSWKRKGFTIDGCIHWLVGSSPKSGLHDFWEEVGIAQNRQFIDMDEYMRFEDSSGRSVIFYSDVDRLEKHLLEFSPGDEKTIREFTDGVRMCLPFDQPLKSDPFLKRILKQIRFGLIFIINGRKMQKWMKTTIVDFAARFKDPLLSEAFREAWIPEFSMFFMLFTFAYLHNRNAGYPMGGSMPMSNALEARYKQLGGIISYDARVEKILVEENRTVGIRLADGTEHRSSKVVSAADGYTTIFKMLGENYADSKIKDVYQKWPLFYPIIFAGIGVNRTFDQEPLTVSGISIPLEKPVEIGDSVRDRIWLHFFNHDPSLAPAGKSVLTITLETDYNYWKKLSEDKTSYQQKKEEIGRLLVEQLDHRYPGIKDQVEMVDIATPMTFERYTGNWKGSFEGWLITPANSYVIMKPMKQTLPGLKNFYMCGQWVEPGGGLPTSIMSGRRLIKSICKEDGMKFKTII